MAIVVSIRQALGPRRLTPDLALKIHQYLLPLEDELGDVHVLNEMHQVIDRHTVSENGPTFVMLYPDQHRAVVKYLLKHSSRPLQALNVWSLLFEHVNKTGEIRIGRAEIAELSEVPPHSVSIIMGELKDCDAITSTRVKIPGVRGPGIVRYFMNHNVGTHLSGQERKLAQAAARKPTDRVTTKPKQGKLQLVEPA
jgi:hypothetical protein